jgi:hypothetical protein
MGDEKQNDEKALYLVLPIASCTFLGLAPVTRMGGRPPQRAKPVEPPPHARRALSIDLRWRQQSMQPVLFIKDCPCKTYR